MDAAISPLTLGVVAGVVLAGVSLRSFVRHRRARRPSYPLPQGADAALWSIVEAVPDPRNHLALTRDLSGEVRLTDTDRALAAALFERTPDGAGATPVEPRRPAVGGRGRPGAVDLRRPRPRRAEPPVSRDEDLTLSGQIFFAGEPQLNRF